MDTPFCDPTARGLRLLADAVDAGECVITSMNFTSNHTQTVMIHIAVRQNQPQDNHVKSSDDR